MVRHPMDVINSFVVGLHYFREWIPPDPWHRFIYTHVPELRLDHDPLERAALYYVRWNEMIERRAAGKRSFFCRIEDGVAGVLEHLGVRCADSGLLAARTVNTRMAGKPGFTFDDIPSGSVRGQLRTLAERYGYMEPAPEAAAGRGLWQSVWDAIACRV